jgi:hypothetical protein
MGLIAHKVAWRKTMTSRQERNDSTTFLADDLIAALRALRERIRARRGGKLITRDIVDQVRQERDEELQVNRLGEQ